MTKRHAYVFIAGSSYVTFVLKFDRRNLGFYLSMIDNSTIECPV